MQTNGKNSAKVLVSQAGLFNELIIKLFVNLHVISYAKPLSHSKVKVLLIQEFSRHILQVFGIPVPT